MNLYSKEQEKNKKYLLNTDDSNKELEKTKKHIHVILHPKRFEKFIQIKKTIDATSDVDVIRYCIDDTFSRMNEDKLEVRPSLRQRAELLLDNDYLRRKYLMDNYNEILNEALHQWIQKKSHEINLHSIPFRRELSEDEQSVSLTLIEHQIGYDRGLTFDNLKSILTDIDDKRLRLILQKFLNNDLLLRTSHDNVDYYYVPLP